MFWSILLPILIKQGIPLAIKLLQKTGALNDTEAWAVKAWVATKEIHKYYAPEDFPNPPKQPTPNNLG